MRVLHVILGNPEIRNGGLIKYCVDLAEWQKKLGHEVYIVYPGSFINSENPRVKKCGKNLYKIFDALPVPITYGVDEPNRYVVPAKTNNFESFIEKISPEVIHVHSIQGIHKEFFEVVHSKKIPIVYTTHDYYPICCKCNLFDYQGELCDGRNDNKCVACNRNGGLSVWKQRVLQLDLYHKVKSVKAVMNVSKKLQNPPKLHQQSNLGNVEVPKNLDVNGFSNLYQYYQNIMKKVQIIHCNSNIAAEQYKKFFSEVRQEVIPITHSGIKKIKHKRKNENVLNVGYMGGMSKHKGFDMIIKTFRKMEDIDGWNLWLYGGGFDPNISTDKRYKFCGFFKKNEEEEVWDNIDLLIVCSQWKETFGFVVLEALARGTPVLCSDLVGSKDLVSNVSDELIFKHHDTVELERKIRKFMNPIYYDECIEKISGIEINADVVAHTKAIMEIYHEAGRTK